MFITKLELHGYKPLLHSRIHSLVMMFTAKTQIIIGQNGSGKSSIMRELTPLPPTRTDFESDGKKIIELIHDDCQYCLTSDFTEQKAHSFIRGNTELNISGNTDIQTELCVKYLGLTPVINSLSTLSKRICSITRSERRDFLLSVHPSNLQFILDKHKKVSSEIRSFNSNLKMLNERYAELKSHIQSHEVLAELTKTKDELDLTSNSLDQLLFCVLNEKNIWSKKIEDVSIDNRSILNKIMSEFKTLITSIQSIKNSISGVSTEKDIEFTIFKLTHLIETKTVKLNEILNISSELKDRIESDKSKLSNDTKETVEKIESEITTTKDLINSIVIDDTLPILPIDTVLQIKEHHYERFKNSILTIRDNGKVWSSNVLREVKTRIQMCATEIRKNTDAVEQLEKEKDALSREIESYESKPYPRSCTLDCILKENRDKHVAELKSYLNKIVIRIKSCTDIIDFNSKRIKRFKDNISPSKQMEDDILYLENLFSYSTWGSVILNGENLIKLLNTNPMYLINQLTKVLKNSEAGNNKSVLIKTLEGLELKHKTLKDISLTSVDMITKTMLDNQLKLQKLIEDYSTESSNIITLNKDLSNVKVFKEQISKLTSLIEKFKYHADQLIIQSHVTFYNSLYSEFNNTKTKITEKLSDLNRIIKEQDGYLTRLNSEIVPLQTSTTTKLKKWSNVEYALSPSKGIPHSYMYRYLNSVIDLTNFYIRKVWTYDLELDLISESDDITFSFPFTLNKHSTVKDISFGSDAQREMIDLAFALSVLTHLGVMNNYPLKLDEPDSGFSHGHRTKLLELLGSMIRDNEISQLFLVNHHFAGYTALKAETLVLSEEDIVVPDVYNEHVQITRF